MTTAGFSVSAEAATKLVVTSPPPGSVPAGQAFSLTVAAEDPFDNPDPSFSGMATITLATNAGGAGTILAGNKTLSFSPSSATPGYVTFTGLSLNNVGNGYKLAINSPTLGTGATAGPFDVTVALPPPPPPPTITGESVMIIQKRKKGKPIGKPIAVDYTIDFSTTMDQTALGTLGNYQVALKSIKTEPVKVGRKN